MSAKISVLLKLIYRTDLSFDNFSLGFFAKIDKLILKLN
jgi:hypothetical protein